MLSQMATQNQVQIETVIKNINTLLAAENNKLDNTIVFSTPYSALATFDSIPIIGTMFIRELRRLINVSGSGVTSSKAIPATVTAAAAAAIPARTALAVGSIKITFTLGAIKNALKPLLTKENFGLIRNFINTSSPFDLMQVTLPTEVLTSFSMENVMAGAQSLSGQILGGPAPGGPAPVMGGRRKATRKTRRKAIRRKRFTRR
jgi:hypothetical protein